ncbi:MAG TPA: hypothetical protein VK674_06610 [Candidatus Limnocylindria bacterium]|nr:hypothetical protein [Candidatus Limnocylindria bacterium]
MTRFKKDGAAEWLSIGDRPATAYLYTGGDNLNVKCSLHPPDLGIYVEPKVVVGPENAEALGQHFIQASERMMPPSAGSTPTDTLQITDSEIFVSRTGVAPPRAGTIAVREQGVEICWSVLSPTDQATQVGSFELNQADTLHVGEWILANAPADAKAR